MECGAKTKRLACTEHRLERCSLGERRTLYKHFESLDVLIHHRK